MSRFYYSNASSKYGASMGRNEYHLSDREQDVKLFMQRVPLTCGGYDPGGAYWGEGTPLWRVEDAHGEVCFYLRALTRDLAKLSVRASRYIGSAPGMGYTNARFYR